jgi:hypothetical protein
MSVEFEKRVLGGCTVFSYDFEVEDRLVDLVAQLTDIYMSIPEEYRDIAEAWVGEYGENYVFWRRDHEGDEAEVAARGRELWVRARDELANRLDEHVVYPGPIGLAAEAEVVAREREAEAGKVFFERVVNTVLAVKSADCRGYRARG